MGGQPATKGMLMMSVASVTVDFDVTRHMGRAIIAPDSTGSPNLFLDGFKR